MPSKYLDATGKPMAMDSTSSLAADLGRGIDADEMVVGYQSIVSNTGTIIGAEALLRWQHRDYGPLLPGRFNQALQEPQVAERISYFVLNRVCRDLGALSADQRKDIYVALNMPLQLLLDSKLPSDIEQMCERYNISPEMLVLEMREDEDLTALASLNALFAPIRQLGVRLALDDFGSDFSSLARLESVRFDVVKLSGQMIRNVPDSLRSCGLVASLIALLRNLSVEIIVEGVEHPGQVSWLNRHPRIGLQGFQICRPTASLAAALTMHPHSGPGSASEYAQTHVVKLWTPR